MKTYIDCIPCFVRQSLDVAQMVTEDPDLQEKIMRNALQLGIELDFSDSPPALAQKMHRMIREITGEKDPYSSLKKRFNQFALNLYPEMKNRIEESEDPLETAVRLAIAGNIIDFGVNSKLRDEEVHHSIKEALKAPIDRTELEKFHNRVEESSDILYLGDNAGEIVFDRLLIETIDHDKVTFAVKGSPIINDALMEDAEETGIVDVAGVIENGADVPGTILDYCDDEFVERFWKADLVIAKGQGNYETLSDEDREIFFLLKAKCPVIARDIGCEIGSIVITRSDASHSEKSRPVIETSKK